MPVNKELSSGKIKVMEIIRSFFAIDLPAKMLESIQHTITQLQNNKLPVKWSKLHNLHITLQFLKEVRSDDMMVLIDNARKTLQYIPPFEVELSHLELFPHPEHPRFISIAPKSNEALAIVAERIGQGILATGYPIETRAFRPHLTLGKFNSVPSSSFSFKNITLPAHKKFWVNEVIFYQSSPTKEGTHYIPLSRIELSC